MTKKNEVVLFSATAIALYGYDQGMMSLINTNYDYLDTMGIKEEDPLVGIIVSVYYLGCAVGAIMGLGVGGIDSTIPVYSSELNSEGGRGVALAKEFQSNIFGLNMAFAINLGVTNGLGKDNQWGKHRWQRR